MIRIFYFYFKTIVLRSKKEPYPHKINYFCRSVNPK